MQGGLEVLAGVRQVRAPSPPRCHAAIFFFLFFFFFWWRRLGVP